MKERLAHAGLIFGMLLLVAILTPSTGASIRLTFVGDVMLGRAVAQSHSTSGWEEVLDAIAPDIARADISFANLESPITQAPLVKESYDLRAPLQSVQALEAAGIDVVSISNNHIEDAGARGIEDTIAALKSVGVQPIGPSDAPLLLRVHGADLAWFAFTDTFLVLNPVVLRETMEGVRTHVDYIIVSMHWGTEGRKSPNDRQRTLAQALADAGADIVIGHHPHVLQPVEWVWGVGRSHPTLVAYSLGNALFDQGAPPSARRTAVLMINLGPVGVKEVCAVPFRIDPGKWVVAPASSSIVRDVISELGVNVCPED